MGQMQQSVVTMATSMRDSQKIPGAADGGPRTGGGIAPEEPVLDAGPAVFTGVRVWPWGDR